MRSFRFKCFLSILALGSAGFAAMKEKPLEPLSVSHGEEITLTDYLVPGKTVIFAFNSQFCPPCRAYDGPLGLLHTRRGDLVVVRVDINRPGTKVIDVESPVARQFGLHGLPHFKVYSPKGKLLAEDKLVIGPDGQPDRTLSSSKARELVNGWINTLGN